MRRFASRSVVVIVIAAAALAACGGGGSGEGPTTTRQRNSALPEDSAVDTSVPSTGSTDVPGTDPVTTDVPATDAPATASGIPASVALSADGSSNGDEFGGSVVVSSDGSTLAVSSMRRDGEKGAVTLYSRRDSKWADGRTISLENGKAGDWFGYSMALSSDGGTLAVGAVYADVDGKKDAGNVSVWKRSGGTWKVAKVVTAPDAAAGDIAGVAVAVSADGSTVAFGVSGSDAGGRNSGSAVVVTEAGGWADPVVLSPSKPVADGNFGASLSLSTDGTTLAVGGPSGGTGAAYVFLFRNGKWS